MALFQSLSRSATAALGRRAARFRFYSAVPGTMRAVVVNETGPAEVLTYVEDHAVPQVADGQVLVQNEFAGINFIDTYHRGGLYLRELPFIGGQEGGGKIVVTTPAAEAQGFAVGDSVVYSVFGSYAEYSVCSFSLCVWGEHFLLRFCRVAWWLPPLIRRLNVSAFFPELLLLTES